MSCAPSSPILRSRKSIRRPHHPPQMRTDPLELCSASPRANPPRPFQPSSTSPALVQDNTPSVFIPFHHSHAPNASTSSPRERSISPARVLVGISIRARVPSSTRVPSSITHRSSVPSVSYPLCLLSLRIVHVLVSPHSRARASEFHRARNGRVRGPAPIVTRAHRRPRPILVPPPPTRARTAASHRSPSSSVSAPSPYASTLASSFARAEQSRQRSSGIVPLTLVGVSGVFGCVPARMMTHR